MEFDEDRSEPYDRTVLTRDDEIIFSNNIFENNDSETGNTFESIEFSGNLDFSGSNFDVAYTDQLIPENNGVPEYWVKGSPGVLFDYHDAENPITYDHPAITSSHVYIDNQDPLAHDEDYCGIESSKCKTLSYTLRK